MARADAPPRTVVIIGAGVIGLSCALKLQSVLRQRGPDQPAVEILLVAREWPTSIPGAPPKHSPDYASMWAGAHVRPIPASNPQLKREAKWLKETVEEFGAQIKAEPAMGLTSCLGIEYLEAPPPEYQQQTKQSFTDETGLPGYKKLGEAEVPEGVELGYEYQTYCINAPLYCSNLLRKYILQGGKTLERDIRTEWEAFVLRPNVEFVINASGTGFRDLKCFPTRGQTVITNFTAATKTVTRQSKDGSWSFIIPRFFTGGTIIGGTKEPGNWQSEPNPQIRANLLAAGQKLFSHAAEKVGEPLCVIADVVGRRPTREGGMRIEVEERHWTGPDGQLKNGPVLHAYGAGGRGFEISWGVANQVAEVARALLPSAGKRAKL